MDSNNSSEVDGKGSHSSGVKLEEASPSLEESEPDRDDALSDGSDGEQTVHRQVYGSGNFRRAARYYKPRMLMRASVRNVKSDKLRKSMWHREPAPEFCNESILIHDECDANLISPNKRMKEKRWSFNLEDGNCYLYEDPCPLFKRHSFRQLPECLATCWRQPTLL